MEMLTKLDERKQELVINIQNHANAVSYSFETQHVLNTTNFQLYRKQIDLHRVEVSGAQDTPLDKMNSVKKIFFSLLKVNTYLM